MSTLLFVLIGDSLTDLFSFKFDFESFEEVLVGLGVVFLLSAALLGSWFDLLIKLLIDFMLLFPLKGKLELLLIKFLSLALLLFYFFYFFIFKIKFQEIIEKKVNKGRISKNLFYYF